MFSRPEPGPLPDGDEVVMLDTNVGLCECDGVFGGHEAEVHLGVCRLQRLEMTVRRGHLS